MKALKSSWIPLFLLAGLGVSGCAKVSVRTTLEEAEERTLVRWEPVEDSLPTLRYDKGESLRSGSLDVCVLRKEMPVYAVKGAQVTVETTSRKLVGAPAMGIDLPYPFCAVTIPVAAVTYSVMAVVGFPDKYYEREGTCERVRLTMAAGEAQGKTQECRWSPAPDVWVRCTLGNGETLASRSDSSGLARFDLLAVAHAPDALEKGISMDFKLRKKGLILTGLKLEPEEVAVLLNHRN